MSKVFTIVDGLENLGAMRTGGQGSVYKGRRQAAIYTAVKLLPTPVHSESGDDKNYRSFQNEVSKLLKVNEQASPYVVKILSSGITETGSFPFIEMEYIEGPDLSELLQEPHPKVFPIREVIKVADQLALALAHCHRVGVMHGDIKSNNVRFNTRSGNYVLLDFGLAAMNEEQRRTSMRHAGAIEFMAPEQSRGEMLSQTDVYSYGVILFELLAGQVPFPLDNHSETARNTVMVAHMEQEVPDPLELRRQHMPAEWTPEQITRELAVPTWLLKILDCCLKKEPGERYRDGQALQEAVAEGSLQAAEAAMGKTEAVTAPVQGLQTGESVTALQSENERLLALVSQFQQEKQVYEQERIDEFSTSRVYLSRPVFTGLLVLLFAFMIFSGYALFFQKHPIGPAAVGGNDTTATASSPRVDTPMRTESNYNTPERDTSRKMAADSIQRAIIRQAKAAREAEKRQQQQADSAQQNQEDTTGNNSPSGNE